MGMIKSMLMSCFSVDFCSIVHSVFLASRTGSGDEREVDEKIDDDDDDEDEDEDESLVTDVI